jgi:hypothetical protein
MNEKGQKYSGGLLFDEINSISISGNGVLIDQLRQIFVPQK